MFRIRSAFPAAVALLLQSTIAPAALVSEQGNDIKQTVLQGPLSRLNCLEGWRLKADDMAASCAMVMTIIIRDFEERGYMGRDICPAPRTPYNEMFDAITDHLIAEKPEWTERAVYVALNALMQKYPCRRSTRRK